MKTTPLHVLAFSLFLLASHSVNASSEAQSLARVAPVEVAYAEASISPLAVQSSSRFGVGSNVKGDDLEKAGDKAASILDWFNEQVKKLWAWLTEDLLRKLRNILPA